MYKRLYYTFLNNNNVIYNLQFGFRNITESIRKAPDDGNIGWRVFVYLQKAFYTVNHEVLLSKLNHYWISVVSNDWFNSMCLIAISMYL